MRKIPPSALLAKAALDHAPFFLPNDAGNPTIREVWTFLDMFSQSPSLPVVAWFHYLQRNGGLTGISLSGYRVSDWLSEQRKQCHLGFDKAVQFELTPDGQAVLEVGA